MSETNDCAHCGHDINTQPHQAQCPHFCWTNKHTKELREMGVGGTITAAANRIESL